MVKLGHAHLNMCTSCGYNIAKLGSDLCTPCDNQINAFDHRENLKSQFRTQIETLRKTYANDHESGIIECLKTLFDLVEHNERN